MIEMCRLFDIEEKLDKRPAQVDPEDVRLTAIVRELSKFPQLIILGRPRDSLSPKKFGLFMAALKSFIQSGVPVIMFSLDESLSGEFSNREIIISEGALTCSLGVNPKSGDN